MVDATKVLPDKVENCVGFAPGTCPLIEETKIEDADNVE
jgi:hypothetical protein